MIDRIVAIGLIVGAGLLGVVGGVCVGMATSPLALFLGAAATALVITGCVALAYTWGARR